MREDVLKKILISNIVTKRFAVEEKERRSRVKEIREKMKKKKEQQKVEENNKI